MICSVFIRYIELPFCVEAVVLPNTDDTYDIYVNSQISFEKQKKAVKHEMSHIKHDHLYDQIKPVVIEEQEAAG